MPTSVTVSLIDVAISVPPPQLAATGIVQTLQVTPAAVEHACGNKCVENTICVAGSCQCPSATSTLFSNGTCMDTKSIERTAVPVATSVTIYWPSCCNGVCTDMIYDNVDNCGTCGNKYLHPG